MGLIVSIDYDPDEHAAKLKITYTAMGCPAMDMIQDDIRARLLREPGRRAGRHRGRLGSGLDASAVESVRAGNMRGLGISV